jgi:sialidase-1
MAFSNDDGTTWTPPVILLRLRSQRQSYPQVFERRPGELWVTTWQGRSFIKLKEADFVGK